MKRVPEELKRLKDEIFAKDSPLILDLMNSVRHYTVALVTIPNTQKESPWPCGTATLVAVNDKHYFLTAAHVWAKLKKFRGVGITLVENLDQRFVIETDHLIPTGPAKPAEEQDGPDIVLLRIPDAKLGEIKARKSFYPLGVKRPKVSAVAIEVAILLGAPGESATLPTPATLDMVIQAIVANPRPKRFTKGKYDYMDGNEWFEAYGFPKSYGGFSGGGRWHVYVYLDPKTGERKERRHLAGMAFYEFKQKRKYRLIRCHGAKSIATVRKMLRPEMKTDLSSTKGKKMSQTGPLLKLRP
jgi:hypothetical protein